MGPYFGRPARPMEEYSFPIKLPGGNPPYIYILEVQGRASHGLHFIPEALVNSGTHRESGNPS